MSREIKFRAWDGDIMWDVREITWNAGGIESLYLGLHSQEMSGDIKVMQFTGLLDKSGREIYEGDIGKDEENGLYVVRFEDGSFETVYDGNITEFLSETRDSLEIIGNIWEHRELLEVHDSRDKI